MQNKCDSPSIDHQLILMKEHFMETAEFVWNSA